MKLKRIFGTAVAGLLAASVFCTAFATPVLADDDDDFDYISDGYDYDYDGDEDVDDLIIGMIIADAVSQADEEERQRKAKAQAAETERQKKEAERQRQEAEQAKKNAEAAKNAADAAQQKAVAAQKEAQAQAQAAYVQQLMLLQAAQAKNSGAIIKMPNGAVFDANYYAAAYPDVVKAIGSKDPKKLYNHYMNYGIKEGRLCFNPALAAYYAAVLK
ncbi:MAG: hypothetical protein K6E33_05330 [Lachnospiraceae bacterium]|nr:hypothetical protein [Lachnospiraceae bacterium]